MCAWPVQQTVVMLFGGSMKPIINFGVSMPFIIVIGYALNVFIEKRIIKLVENKIFI